MSANGDGESTCAGERVYLHIYDYETKAIFINEEYIKEFSGLTTYHGLVRIYNSNTWPSRIFWCVVVLSCLSLFMIHSGYLLLGYHSKPTLFQVKTIVASDGVPFPDITICKHNPIDMSRLCFSQVTLLEIFIYLFKSVWGTVNTERQKQFMEAMMEEENERRQSVVIVEDPHRQLSTGEEPADDDAAHTRKRHSRRVSLVPLHIHMDKRGSTN
ncbi:hypothetical protein TELCIR_13985, partial [Teladorsagia circumcincta]